MGKFQLRSRWVDILAFSYPKTQVNEMMPVKQVDIGFQVSWCFTLSVLAS